MPADPLSLAAHRDDVLLTREAVAFGMTNWSLESLRRGSGLSLPRGAIAVPPVRDPVRTRARATQLLLEGAVISHTTAARLHGLAGLDFWTPEEPVEATVAPGATRWQRRATRLHFQSLGAAEVVDVKGLRVTSVGRTLRDCGTQLGRIPFICLLDSALNQQLLSPVEAVRLKEDLRSRRRAASAWVNLADPRAESPSETRVRLVLGDADLLPDELQIDVWTDGGFHVARLDMGWVRQRRRVGMEVDSAEHDRPRALYRDRERLNDLRSLGWDIRQVTAWDARNRPGYIVEQARRALGLR